MKISIVILLFYLTSKVINRLIKTYIFFLLEIMVNIDKPKFHILDVSGNNYLS